MKKLLSICILFGSLCLTSVAQETKVDEKTLSSMSFDELQAYQKVLKAQFNNANRTAELPSVNKLQEYATVGKALGQAFKECWSVVSTDAERFAQSPAGKWTAFLITWKVMGKDAVDLTKTAVRWIVGGSLMSTITIFFAFIVYRNCISKRVLLSEERTSMFNFKRTYSKELSCPMHEDSTCYYGIAYGILMIVCGFIMFAG